MKVLIVSSRFHPDVLSGGQVSSFYIAKSLNKQGNEVNVLTLYQGKKLSEKTIEGIKITRVPHKKTIPFFSNLDLMWWQIVKQSIKYVRKIKPDIIHLVNFEPLFYTPIFLKSLFPNIAVVTTVNGPLFGCFTQNATDYRKKTCVNCKVFKRYLCSVDRWKPIKGTLSYLYGFWYMWLLRFSYKYVDKFFLVSKAMSPLITNMGVPKRKLKIVYNPFETKKIKLSATKKKNIRQKYGIKNEKVILFAGRLGKEKGIHKVIQAIKTLENVVFLIVGNKRGDYVYFKSLVKSLGLTKKVKFIGFLEHEKVLELYTLTDLVVLPETFYEPLSRLLIEANIYSIPAIATNMGGNSEIIDNNTGILLKTLDIKELTHTIKKLLTNDKLRKELGKNAREKAIKKYDIVLFGKKLQKEYQNLIDLR